MAKHIPTLLSWGSDAPLGSSDPQGSFPGRPRPSLHHPPASLMKEQWCKIRWGEKQEVEPESRSAAALPSERGSPSTRSLTGKR